MGTRVAVRPRQLDQNKPLPIVRTVEELDNSQQLFKDPSPGEGSALVAKKGAKEIPVPDVRHVPTHYRDYLPAHISPPTYIRGKGQPVGGVVRPDHRYVEYDLDAEDEDWVERYGLGGSKLSDQKFERMLWVLELACAEAQEVLWNAAGASYAERTSATAVAATDALSRTEALTILAQRVGARDVICRDVYQYWLAKRKKWGKPLLTRLQAPTPANDSNPHRVFRPREKVNRPQTRRRRENTEDCYDKLKQMKDNLTHVRNIVDEIVRRERRKRDLMCTELEFLNIELQKRLHPGRSQDEFYNAALNTLKERMKLNQDNDKKRTALMVLPNGQVIDNNDANAALRPSRRIRTPHVLSVLRNHMQRIPAPPRPLEEDTAFSSPILIHKLPAPVKAPNGVTVNTAVAVQQTGDGGLVHPLWRLPGGFPWELTDPTADFQVVRMGRNGRARIERCDAFSGDSLHDLNQEQLLVRQMQAEMWPALPNGQHLQSLIAEMQPGAPVFQLQQAAARAASRQSSHGVAAQGSMPLQSMASAQAAQLRQAAVQQQMQQQQAAAAAAAAAQQAAVAPVQAATAAQPVAMGRGSGGGAAVPAAAAGGEGVAAAAAAAAPAAAGAAAPAQAAGAVPAVAPAAVPPVAVAASDPAAAAGSSGAGAGWYGAAASAAMVSVGGNPAATVVAPTAPPNIAGAVQTPTSASTVAAKRTPAVKTESKLPGTNSGQLPPAGPASQRRGPGRPPKRQDDV